MPLVVVDESLLNEIHATMSNDYYSLPGLPPGAKTQ